MHLANRILIFLSDGEPHLLGEVLQSVEKYIDPKIAVRRLTRGREKDYLSIEEKVSKGKQWVIFECLLGITKRGHITHQKKRNEVWNNGLVLQITEKGLDRAKELKEKNET